jgi:predicted ABC-class ATPase
VSALSAVEIRGLLESLNSELAKVETVGELYLVGGAVMCLALSARASTQDIDAVFRPVTKVRAAAKRVAAAAGVDPHWLNDGVKTYLSARGDFASFLDLSHLRVMVAEPSYLFAMKCLAMRLGAEFHDEEDVRFLLRLLDVPSYEQALEMITPYHPLERILRKTLYSLEELLSKAM